MRMPSLSLFLAACLVVPASADVMVVRTIQSDGIAGFGGGTKNMTTWIGGDKHRQETKGEGKPSMLEQMAGMGRPEITRLDKKVIWRLLPSKKAYQEQLLALPKTSESESEPSDDVSPESDQKPTSRISKAEFKVTPLGEKKRFGAYDCEGYTMKALLEIEDLESHEKTEMRVVTTMWNAAETGAVAQLKKEEVEYAQAYARALGITDVDRSAFKMLGGALAAGLAGSGEKELSRALAKLPAELKKIKGYPIVTRIDWYTKEDQATHGADEGETSMDEIPTDVSSALGSLAGGLMKKKMEAKKPAATAEGRPIFGMTTEIKSISVSAIPADVFEVPAGYKKAK